ncbi:MAG: hypothetical protein Q9209_004207 [Squamulea sp. 1 TL-2023]
MTKHGLNSERKVLPIQTDGPPPTPTTPGFTTTNQEAFESNAQIISTPRNPKQVNGSPMVLVPPLSAASLVGEYKTFCEDEPLSHCKTERKDQPVVVVPPNQTRDQRAAADQASSHLQTLIQGIFDAEDQITEENAAAPSIDASSYFTWVQQEGAEIRMLATDKLVKLDSCLLKAIAADRLGDISIHDSIRLQKLCEGSLAVIQPSELSIDATWSSDDFLAWLQRVGFAESALRSARIIVRIVIGLQGEKDVCSEEILQNLVSVLNQIINSCIVPIVEARPKETGVEVFDLASPHRKEIGQLLYQANRVMKMLVEMLDKVDIAEVIITALEFLAVRILFVENAQHEKESILGIQKFEALRRTAMEIITGIFTKHPEQRSFIFDEILSSLQKLPTRRQNARQFKLSDGTSIQLVSALIMTLIQTSAAPTQNLTNGAKPRIATGRKRSHSKSFSSDSETETSTETMGDSEPSKVPSVDSDAGTDNNPKRLLSTEANELSNNAAKDAQYVVGYFVRRAMTASKTGDQPYRHLLDIFIEDLILVISNAEWPAAELLLNVLMSIMMNIAENKSTAPAKNMALELLGIMGSAISELVASTQSLARNLETQDSARSDYLRQMFDEYTDGRFQSSELFLWDGPYRIVLDYLASIDSDGLPTRSAQMFYLTQWARNVTSTEFIADLGGETMVHQLKKMLSNKAWNLS